MTRDDDKKTEAEVRRLTETTLMSRAQAERAVYAAERTGLSPGVVAEHAAHGIDSNTLVRAVMGGSTDAWRV